VRGFEAVAFADPRSFAATLATADLVVSAAGTSALEICCLGLPSVLFSVAGNQRPVAAALAAAGAALDAGDVSALSAPSLAGNVAALARDAGRLGELATQAWRLVDGEGVMRLLARMRTAVVRLRPATSADARSLFEWRTDELTQRWSFSDDAIEWEHHVAWLERTLADAGTKLFIAEDRAGAAVGQVRFDLDPASNRAEVSIGLAAAARGSGLGAAIVAAGVDDLFESTPVTTVVARIKPGNTASINTFVRADFDDAGVEGSGGREVLLYSRQRDAART
jgi:RimJ/RimL family protein N-acetyltransferase